MTRKKRVALLALGIIVAAGGFFLALPSLARWGVRPEARSGASPGGSSREQGGGGSAVPAGPAGSDSSWQRVQEGQDLYIADSLGNRVPLRPYGEIIVLAAGAVETIFALGGGDRIIATVESRIPIAPAEETARLPTVGTVSRVSLEHLVMADPDLVIVDPMNPDLAGTLYSRGIPALVYNPASVKSILEHAEILGDLTETGQEAREMVISLESLLEQRQRDREGQLPLRGLFIYTAHPMQAFASTSLAGDILRLLGVENLADPLTGARPIVSPEYLLTADPDFIWGAMSLQSVDDILLADQAVVMTRAGREKNIEIIPSTMIMRASVHLLEEMERLAEKLPPHRSQS
ncbi:iron complex transport system substrate-binding protein [Alkalispirochaeta americana]|uniref:Iron complex transport system substrate-binding protein n=1 Tax=Alkalispirochaeta americana TaxID=159291 RepID=A0A1N6Q6D5_9SPIO|nr:ABC transporter substrate-binding protein [Alkalispirochaeta americana]SIQ12087.1 iron complex transport system substrate-binding protein [Alkalispirochaeta americana]